eukprot:Pgem_evm2s12680
MVTSESNVFASEINVVVGENNLVNAVVASESNAVGNVVTSESDIIAGESNASESNAGDNVGVTNESNTVLVGNGVLNIHS